MHELNLSRGENREPPYLAKNPMGKIPTFEDDDGWTLWESLAIVVYLGEKYPERGLYPTDLRGRADALRWLLWGAAHIEPNVVPMYRERVLVPVRGGKPDEAIIAAAEKELPRFLPILDAHLSTRPYVLGEKFSLVDVGVGATFDGLFHPAVKFDASVCPNVHAWHQRIAARPSWNVAMPKKAS